MSSIRSFYFLRAAVAYVWVAAVATTHPGASPAAAFALALYAAWDAIANLIDIRRHPIANDIIRQVNVAVSFAAAGAMAAGAVVGFDVTTIAFGIWALVAGALQLAVGIRRRSSTNGQVLMILSGAQSALAGIFFTRLGVVGQPTIADLFPYAAVGATYFLVAGLWMLWRERGAPHGVTA